MAGAFLLWKREENDDIMIYVRVVVGGNIKSATGELSSN